MRYRLRLKYLYPDTGAGAGGGSPTTNPTVNPANPTAGAQANPTQAGGAGAGTDPVTTPSQVAPIANPATPTNPAHATPPANEPKFTDADMAAARRAWEAETQRQAEAAAKAAADEAAIENGKAKEIAATRLQTIHDLEAKIAKMEPVLTQNIADLSKDWPQYIIDKKPKDGGYEALLSWYDTFKDVAAEVIKATAQNTSASNYKGNGYTPPPPGGGSGGSRPVDSYINSTYAPKKS